MEAIVETSKQYETRRQLSDRLHLSERTLEKLAQEQSGPPMVRVGRRVMYPSAEADQWMAERMVPAAA